MTEPRQQRWRMHHGRARYLCCECGADMYVPEWSQTTGDEELVLRAQCNRGHNWLLKIAMLPQVRLFAWRTDFRLSKPPEGPK